MSAQDDFFYVHLILCVLEESLTLSQPGSINIKHREMEKTFN